MQALEAFRRTTVERSEHIVQRLLPGHCCQLSQQWPGPQRRIGTAAQTTQACTQLLQGGAAVGENHPIICGADRKTVFVVLDMKLARSGIEPQGDFSGL
ncbi:hypothetical protein D3C76_828050 [compost metagenome]